MVGAFFMGAAGQNRRFLAKAYMGVRITLWPQLEISPMHQPTIALHRPAPNLGKKSGGLRWIALFDLLGFDPYPSVLFETLKI